MFTRMERVVVYIVSVVASGVQVTESRLIDFKHDSRLFHYSPCVRGICLEFNTDSDILSPKGRHFNAY